MFQNVWNPETALQFLDMFLTYVKNCFKEHVKETIGSESNLRAGPITLQFELDINRRINMTNHIDLESDAILPNWFIDGIRE